MPDAPGARPRFSVVIPTLGRASLVEALEALRAQTFPRVRFEVLVVFDGVKASPLLIEACEAASARPVVLERRSGPGAARNAAAQIAVGEILAFTEDDCVVDVDWLRNAATRFDREPALEVLDGLTLYPDGRRKPGGPGNTPVYLPTDLFVERARFDEVGGYCEDFFDRDTGLYFREDSDFGFSLEAAGATITRDDCVIVTHPHELPQFLDPLRWARRYVMDPLLAHRHPERFRDRIEVVSIGPLRVRRPFVRACVAYLVGLGLLAVGLLAGLAAVAVPGLVVAIAALGVIWTKWRFDLRRLPTVPIVPFVLVYALARGELRARRIVRDPGRASQ